MKLKRFQLQSVLKLKSRWCLKVYFGDGEFSLMKLPPDPGMIDKGWVLGFPYGMVMLVKTPHPSLVKWAFKTVIKERQT